MKKQRPLTNWLTSPHQGNQYTTGASGALDKLPQPTWASLIRRRIFDPAARRTLSNQPPSSSAFTRPLPFDALDRKGVVWKDPTHPSLVMAVSTFPNMVYFESSHMHFQPGGFLWSPHHFQTRLHSRVFTFGVVQPHVCRRPSPVLGKALVQLAKQTKASVL